MFYTLCVMWHVHGASLITIRAALTMSICLCCVFIEGDIYLQMSIQYIAAPEVRVALSYLWYCNVILSKVGFAQPAATNLVNISLRRHLLEAILLCVIS